MISLGLGGGISVSDLTEESVRMVIIASSNISVEFAESLVMELIIAGKVEVMTEIEMIDGIILTETDCGGRKDDGGKRR